MHKLWSILCNSLYQGKAEQPRGGKWSRKPKSRVFKDPKLVFFPSQIGYCHCSMCRELAKVALLPGETTDWRVVRGGCQKGARNFPHSSSTSCFPLPRPIAVPATCGGSTSGASGDPGRQEPASGRMPPRARSRNRHRQSPWHWPRLSRRPAQSRPA